jgi:uncharacterized protein (DUF2252 family)
MKIFKATRKYEKWLRQELIVFEEDVSFKAKKLADNPSAFLRGTFYRWMQLWPNTCKKIADAPVVLSVGDLHAATQRIDLCGGSMTSTKPRHCPILST